MAKLKHSFLKNSLQLFCYKNVLNNEYSKYDNCIIADDEDEDERKSKSKINDNKRKLNPTTTTNPKGKYSIVPSTVTKPNSTSPSDQNIEPKKLQNIYIHYSENNTTLTVPDVISSSKSTHSPKSPLSKHAKQEEKKDENLPDIIMISGAEAAALDAMKRKGVNSSKKKSRSKSINSTKKAAVYENGFYNRSRILSPIPALSAISSANSDSTTQNNSNFIIKPPTTVPIVNSRQSMKQPSSAPASSQSQASNNRNYNRQSYPPDITFLTQSNTMRNRNSYTLAPLRTPLQIINKNENKSANEAPTSSNTSPLYHRNNTMKHSNSTTNAARPVHIKNSESDFSFDKNNFNRQFLRYQSTDGNQQQHSVNGVKLRHSRLTNSEFIDKSQTKRSLSAISTSSAKKSVRFADSVGLELENIFNLSSLDNNYFVETKKTDFSNENSFYENYPPPPPKPLQLPHVDRQKLTLRNSNNNMPLNKNEAKNGGEMHFNKTKNYTNLQNNNNFQVKTLKLANLTIRTRINTNGKLESEV